MTLNSKQKAFKNPLIKFWGHSSYCVSKHVTLGIEQACMQTAQILGKTTIPVFQIQEE